MVRVVVDCEVVVGVRLSLESGINVVAVIFAVDGILKMSGFSAETALISSTLFCMTRPEQVVFGTSIPSSSTMTTAAGAIVAAVPVTTAAEAIASADRLFVFRSSEF